ncbi:Intersectin 1 (SH3 domain protein) [Homalodisca vitripennis]|nr:Intersectin 1 (SH3 domain protein) [Homalodisca vitripennis]
MYLESGLNFGFVIEHEQKHPVSQTYNSHSVTETRGIAQGCTIVTEPKPILVEGIEWRGSYCGGQHHTCSRVANTIKLNFPGSLTDRCFGKREVFCEVSMGSQEHRTPPANATMQLDPRWNATMQFLVKDLNEDVLCITVLDRGHFTPDEFLGRTEVRISDILHLSQNSRGPIVKNLPLHEVDSGEVTLKLDLRLFDSQ